ncbi:MAG: hypothetical protein M5R37_15135 [Melioribacteraceae bacterium]|nr:hypothetical protein [Melioribacteraceae bacterium]
MIKKLTCTLFFVLINISAQSIYEPVYRTDVYNFLERLSNKAKINVFTDLRPLTRLNLASTFQHLERSANLTSIEKERIEFYKKEYAFEIKYLQKDTTELNEFFRSGETDRFSLYKYYSDKFTLQIDPIIGIGYNFSDKIYHQYGGIQLRGRIGDNWGFYFNYRDNTEIGDSLDRRKSFSPETGIHVLKSEEDLIDYSETRGGITYGWEWGNLTAAKDFLHIGSSSQSSTILSNKSPSLPFLRLEVSPVDWFRYDFIHAWLKSNLIDSNSIRSTGVEAELLKRSQTFSRLQKYYVSHSFSFQPLENWWLTFGESIIYGDNLEFVYFLPVFYRLADHYNSIGGGDTGDNAQIFFNTSYIWSQIKSKLYMTFYLDEFSPSDLFSGGDNAQVYAFTLGGKFTNPLWSNNYITLEYNAIRPYVGMNADPLHSYESSGYQLGHWIGSNSVQIYAEMEQYLPLMINLKVYMNYVMKGEKESINDYYNRDTSTYPLLSGDNSYFSEIGGQISYNPIHDLYLELNFRYINKSTGRFQNEFDQEEGFQFGTMLRYGFQ